MDNYNGYSADVWRKNARGGFIGSFVLSPTIGVVMFMPQMKGNVTLGTIIACLLIAFIAAVGQMFIQWLSIRCLKKAVSAEFGGYNVGKLMCAKHKTMLFWAWTVDWMIFSILCGVAFSYNLTLIACAIPIASAVFIVCIVSAIIWTVRLKNEDRDKEDKTNEEEQ